MSAHWAAPGVKCVCIGLRTYDVALAVGLDAPVTGQIYTVRALVDTGMGLGLLLEEVRNSERPWANGIYEACWALSAFRPLITQADDVALFASHLIREGADA